MLKVFRKVLDSEMWCNLFHSHATFVNPDRRETVRVCYDCDRMWENGAALRTKEEGQ